MNLVEVEVREILAAVRSVPFAWSYFDSKYGTAKRLSSSSTTGPVNCTSIPDKSRTTGYIRGEKHCCQKWSTQYIRSNSSIHASPNTATSSVHQARQQE